MASLLLCSQVDLRIRELTAVILLTTLKRDTECQNLNMLTNSCKYLMSGNGNFVTVPRVLLWPCNEIFQQSKREILVDGRLLKKFFLASINVSIITITFFYNLISS